MPTIPTHAFLGYAITSPWRRQLEDKKSKWTLTILSLALPVIPDLDALFMRWIPYGHPLGHRGLSHSLLFAFLLALVSVLLVPQLRRIFPGKTIGLLLLLFFITALHGVLDAFTDGGKGIGFFIPFENSRYFFPISPIPVAPLGITGMFSSYWVISCFIAEFLLLWTIGAGIMVATIKRFRYRWIVSAVLVLIGVLVWVGQSI